MSEETMNNTAVEHEYGADQIQILEGLEAVRKRPGMYIGTTASRGLHHLVYEIVDNSVDEALAGFCDTIDVTINEDNSVTVVDNGRGIPIGINHKAGIPAVEVVFTILHAGGKFGGGGYKVSGGLHGVGASVVNALSDWLEVEICQEGKVYKQRYERGHVCYPLKEIGTCPIVKTVTTVTFLPDATIFTETTVYDFDVLKRRLREMAFLTKGLRIILRDNRTEDQEEILEVTNENSQISELLRRAEADKQEQLAEKMSVSRSAIAKWETDKGMPDVNNLKTIAKLLNVSVDYLLDDEEKISFNEMKEAINLDDYEKTGKCRDKKDAACVAKNQDADAIYALVRGKKMSKIEWVIDFIVQPGIVDLLDQTKEFAGFYLVEKGAKQYLVKVTKEFIVTNELAEKMEQKKFVVGNHQYKKMYQLV